MKAIASLSFFAFLHAAAGHGGHGPNEGETIQQYARRHMSKEHHIDAFDSRSFFQLHDLNRDGFWDKEEIQAVYGVHHVISQKQSKDEAEHQEKAQKIVDTVLAKIDLNKDGKITADELDKVGLDGLPNFDGLDGHHYDVESEFFLHHEEEYHSTPETQTDDSYNHPEDLEHFAHHEEIEQTEAEREAKYRGVSVEEVLASHDHQEEPNTGDNAAPPAGDEQAQANLGTPPKPKINRVTPPEKQEPSVRYRDAASEGRAKSEWGTGEEGYKAPKAASDKMRKNLPYKYKFKRNWGDF